MSELEQQCTKAQLIALLSVTAVITSFTALSKKQPANVNKQNKLQGAVVGEPLQGANIQNHVCETGSFLFRCAFAHHELNWTFLG